MSGIWPWSDQDRVIVAHRRWRYGLRIGSLAYKGMLAAEMFNVSRNWLPWEGQSLQDQGPRYQYSKNALQNVCILSIQIVILIGVALTYRVI